ncbi:hypothetical protein RN001_003625 [Aquatica leii]|uniref:DDE Tnp4 domain-containing protein n=1 Tax=Aquatica leii TaxID=1421715 RepID=A0AAN7SME7_9COLE|nr:hypothetical protein RN001_003625 [Aquatica leii]
MNVFAIQDVEGAEQLNNPRRRHNPQNPYEELNERQFIKFFRTCDSSLKIINVNARYPGSTNDAYIWNQCNVHGLMQQLHQVGHTYYFLLGDSGYPLRSWFLTPFNNV